MRSIGPETGQLLNILAKSLKNPTILELGTSFGYSGIWLAEAARVADGKLITMELHDYKSAYAQKMAQQAGLANWIDFRVGDAVQMIDEMDEKVDFVFVDLWKDLYVPCLKAFYPRLNPGAIIVADNMIRPGRRCKTLWAGHTRIARYFQRFATCRDGHRSEPFRNKIKLRVSNRINK